MKINYEFFQIKYCWIYFIEKVIIITLFMFNNVP